MNLKSFDDKCVKITTISGEVYEGIVSYCGKNYVYHEYGQNEEALLLVPILFYKSDIADIVSLEDVNGPFGHFSDRYGLLEEKCLDWGTDLIEEVFDSEDDIQISRMLLCMNDNFHKVSAWILVTSVMRGNALLPPFKLKHMFTTEWMCDILLLEK